MTTPTIAFADRLLRLPGPGGGLVPMRWHGAQRAFLEAWDARNSDGTRRWPQGLISWPKQSFKTTTAQIALLADLYTGQGPDREYAVVSTGATQAGDVGFAGLVRFVERAPLLLASTKIFANELVFTETIREARTGGEYTQAHRVTALPSQRAADWHHGRPLTGAWIDEAWALGDHGYGVLEAVMPSPTRDGWLLVTSYAGLKQHTQPGFFLWDLWTRAQQQDPTLLASILQGHAAYADMPHVTARFLADQEALLQHCPGRRDRLWKNWWTTSDEGALLTAREVADSLDPTLPVPAFPLPGVRYSIGVDLGYSHDWAACCLSHVSPEGQVIVDHVAFWQGSPAHPVNFDDVETFLLVTAQRFRLIGIYGDQWQFLQMKERLARRLPAVTVTAVTVESSKLNTYVMTLKQLFAGRLIRIPTEPIELQEQLESVIAVESSARDRLKLESGQGVGARAFDDLVIALLLSLEGHQRLRTKDGRLYGTSDIGRVRMPEITACVAAEVLGVGDIACPIAGEIPSLNQGCRRCPMVLHVEPAYTAHLLTGAEWLSLGQFAQSRYADNTFLRTRRFAATMATFGF